MNKDEFNLDPRHSDVDGWFVLDRNGIWDLTVELDKPTIRLMKRHLPKKVRRRRNRQIAKTASRQMYHDLSEFEKYLINAHTGR